MAFPSIKTFTERLGLTKEQAKELRAAMESGKGLVVGNRMLNAHGLESIGLPDGCFDNCQRPDVDIRYVNMGDTYATTLLKVNGRYCVGSWGDVVEAYDRRHGRAMIAPPTYKPAPQNSQDEAAALVAQCRGKHGSPLDDLEAAHVLATAERAKYVLRSKCPAARYWEDVKDRINKLIQAERDKLSREAERKAEQRTKRLELALRLLKSLELTASEAEDTLEAITLSPRTRDAEIMAGRGVCFADGMEPSDLPELLSVWAGKLGAYGWARGCEVFDKSPRRGYAWLNALDDED